MKSILTEAQSRRNRLQKGARHFSELASTRRITTLYEARNQGKTTLFLSHSHTDRDLLEDVLALIGENINRVAVYVDWMDGGMPAVTSGQTALRIKEKITECHKFVLLASANAIRSNWVNWEVGYGDARKFPRNMALFPVHPTGGGGWPNAEYLQTYLCIVVEEEATA